MQVPVELQDEIIDQLGLDETALKECARVCRSWVYRARYHLFKKIRVGEHTGPRLLELMDSPHCTIASHIRSLTLTESSGQRYKWLDKGLPRLLPVMRLQSLTLQNIFWQTIDPALLQIIEGFSHTIEILHLSYVYFQTFDDFVAFLGAFPCLRKLVLSVLWCGGADLEPSLKNHHISASPQLEVVDLNHCPLDSRVFAWLRSAAQSSVHTVQFWDIAETEFDAINRLLEALGLSLKHAGFSMGKPSRGAVSDTSQCVDLSHNCALQSISLAGINFRGQGQEQDIEALRCITALVSHMQAAQVSSLVFQVCFDSRAMPEKAVWEPITHGLSKFKTLQSVLFVVSCYGAFDEKYLSSCFPQLAKSGVLQVQHL